MITAKLKRINRCKFQGGRHNYRKLVYSSYIKGRRNDLIIMTQVGITVASPTFSTSD